MWNVDKYQMELRIRIERSFVHMRKNRKLHYAQSQQRLEVIFGPAVWLRGLIRPEPGFGVAYIDWSQQKFGIAAALDPLMLRLLQEHQDHH